MAFADEPVEYADRRFICGWSARPQTAADIGARAQQFARCLRLIDPAYGPIRPSPMRKFRADDPGPILDMTSAELTDRIERRGRFDPPRFPAPVSPQGYSVIYRNSLMGFDSSHVSVSVRAGAYGADAVENRVEVWPSTEHELWRDQEQGIRILDAMIETWGPDWAIAFARVLAPPAEILEGPSPVRPWLAWTARPLQPRPNPPYRRPFPYPFPLDDAGPPAEVRAWHGGDLRIWP